MIHSQAEFHGYDLKATDGSIGHIHDFLFDDTDWRIRHLVADTGWIFGRRVILPPEAFGSPDVRAGEIPVNLSKDAIRDSPDIDTEKPVSRQEESRLYGHYGLAPYWAAGALPGAGPVPIPEARPPLAPAEERSADPHLRSAREVVGYTVHATDGDIGAVDDLLIETNGWYVRYLAIDTGEWLPGKKVILSPHWAKGFDWSLRTVRMALTRDRIQAAPGFDPTDPVDRDYEAHLHDLYGYRPYW